MTSVKELSKRRDIFCAGHRACSGCAPAITMRQVTLAVNTHLVTGLSTGCMEVVSSIYPYTAWRSSFIHNAFENVAATISGVETAYRALKKKGKLDAEYRFIAFGGDGGTYDIGLQSLSGAMERGHRMLYVCYDNQGYMNTGIQRSSSTPYGAATSTSPAGIKIAGKQQFQKDLTEIMVAHELPYVAQASIGYYRDLNKKVEKALAAPGPSFINVLACCHRGWRIEPADSLKYSKLGVDTCMWPLYEVENGVYKLSMKPREKLPIEEWLKGQGRFNHMFKPDNADMIKKFQEHVDEKWNRLLWKCGELKERPGQPAK
ncbi:MAG: pyruvate ferredoxin oxidoreductase [Candidatus Abyssobacteria bacterium SURF_17]|uniref:Pyruvate ferredoxin oxidoreductase n=1 Tax=Candidatus Abyssobacteria bacterium SURF_17 TaxID=2093361 RepID=A0A419F805_9BACT|nr:MAG: pyruvate ferredoxin oxidoreductase [Candidatus Abyssubacteria bacterium SURF_17]